MSKKTENYYFDNFYESISISCRAAEMLKTILSDFNVRSLPEQMIKFHEIEHSGDEKKHELVSVIVKDFMTPLERDDIMMLSHNIDNVTDAIEDILINIYMCGITKIREDALKFSEVIIDCCNSTKKLVDEFRNFKKSKKLKEYIIDINRIEEIGDQMYVDSMRKLHTDPNNDVLQVIAWREIYGIFEFCCDACEDVADVVEGIVIGNI